MTTEAEVIAGLTTAQQVANMAGALAVGVLPPGSKAGGYVQLATGLLGLLAQAIDEQTTEDLPDLTTLDAQELVILAADQKAQADAAAKTAPV